MLETRKYKELEKRMHKLGVYEKDLKESFVRSSGPGGQNVNKTATCVVLRHVPSGIQVKCQEERSQRVNRHKARWIILEKIEQQNKTEQLKIIQEKEKQKRQRRKKPTLLKEVILEQKHRQSAKKIARRKIDKIDLDE